MSTQLLDNIRKGRVQRRNKQPLASTRFTRMAWMVKEYGLREEILTQADRFIGVSLRQKLAIPRVRIKKRCVPPPFVVLTREEYDVALRILERIDSSYLDYVCSPEEIVLAGPLYRRNSRIEITKLERYHFESLLLYELANEEVQNLLNHVANLDVKVGELLQGSAATASSVVRGKVPHLSQRLMDKEKVQLNLTRDRIDRLLKFLAKIDGSETEQEGK